ncbi:hypothetical protein JTE90_017188 [Oedothorax gibbosus]|uniref:Uncharacterized protein n=1 Tax=Oedothorax gibbosus TaxID=931172 RepID=A0AAV6V940_9ARAC|nr:hypothetical protein JTE90_017188 [Oedothorax gibbosus]
MSPFALQRLMPDKHASLIIHKLYLWSTSADEQQKRSYNRRRFKKFQSSFSTKGLDGLQQMTMGLDILWNDDPMNAFEETKTARIRSPIFPPFLLSIHVLHPGVTSLRDQSGIGIRTSARPPSY